MTVRPASLRNQPHWTWWLMAVFSALIAAYAFANVALGPRMYPPELAPSFKARPWGIYPHAFFGGLALLVGPMQFHRGILQRRRALHRTLGMVYLVGAGLTGIAGLYMSAFAGAGWIARLGFAMLAVLLLTTTTMAYAAIRARRINEHREWMLRSYALLFGAVTLRIELPLLIAAYGGLFGPAYRIVAWLSWVPNLAWVTWHIRSTRPKQRVVVDQFARE